MPLASDPFDAPIPGLHACIDPIAVAHNLEVLRQRLGVGVDGPRIWATVKADAYGHGLHNVLPGLRAADGIAVRHLHEAHQCRRVGWSGPIMVYAGLTHEREAALLTLQQLHLVITDMTQLEWLPGKPLYSCAPWVWLRYIGATRLGGLDASEYRCAYARCRELQQHGALRGVGHLNHYANAASVGDLEREHADFEACIRGLPGPVSTCNSAAACVLPTMAARTDWVRPGLALYGVSPIPGRAGRDLGLRPAMTLRSTLCATQNLPAGASVGYGCTFVADQPMALGLVRCGYGDGSPHNPRASFPVQVDGVLTRTVGRISMDLMAVDLRPIPAAARGAPVVLWGSPQLPVEHIAHAAGTIAAELLTGLTARVPLMRADHAALLRGPPA